MGLIVEDGTVVPGANSYVTMEQADEYHASRNNTAWADAESSPDTAREGALIRAAQWLDNHYRAQFPGAKVGGRAQSMQWPRTGATDADGNEIPDDEIPAEMMSAQCEAALRELSSPGSLSPDSNASQRVVREKVGDLEVQYSDGVGADDMAPMFSLIDDILSGLLGDLSAGGSMLFGSTLRS